MLMSYHDSHRTLRSCFSCVFDLCFYFCSRIVVVVWIGDSMVMVLVAEVLVMQRLGLGVLGLDLDVVDAAWWLGRANHRGFLAKHRYTRGN